MKELIENLVKKANFSLRKDVLFLLKNAYRKEKNKKAKMALKWILENCIIAKKENIAICQDTGLPILFWEVGKDKKLDYRLVKEVEELIEKSYKKYFLRPSIVDALKRGSPGYKGVVSYIEFTHEKAIKLTLLVKGFGSENKTQLKMFSPTSLWKEIEDFVIESIKKGGPDACPPFIVGIGIGGTSEDCLMLAKKSLLERVDKPNKDKFLAKLEEKLLKKINTLKIGPFGFGGKFTALAVKIKTSFTHIAGLPVGVNISCWALRSAKIKLL
jgi:fumarate hydratase subunit alpha